MTVHIPQQQQAPEDTSRYAQAAFAFAVEKRLRCMDCSERMKPVVTDGRQRQYTCGPHTLDAATVDAAVWSEHIKSVGTAPRPDVLDAAQRQAQLHSTYGAIVVDPQAQPLTFRFYEAPTV